MSRIALELWRDRAAPAEIVDWLVAGETVTLVRPRDEDCVRSRDDVAAELDARGVEHHRLPSGGLATSSAQLHVTTGGYPLHFVTDRLVGDWQLCRSTGALRGIERPPRA